MNSQNAMPCFASVGGDRHLVRVLQEEFFAQAEDRRGLILQTYQSALTSITTQLRSKGP